MKLFLKLKHWQIFLFVFAIPVLLQGIFLIGSNFRTDSLVTFKINPVIGLISATLFWCWIWAISYDLRDKIPEGIELSTDFFKLFFIVSVIFSVLYTVFVVIFLGSRSRFFHPGIGFLFFLLPLFLFMIYSNLYCLYFASKIFKTVELKKQVKFSDFAGDFFLFMFYPIGVWIVQPKINNMINNEETPSNG